jgi:hypothetical protein
MNSQKIFYSLFAAAAVLAPSAGRADCSRGADYQITVATNSVTVCTVSSARKCGSTVTLLRQNEADGSVVAVANACSSNGCYVDECVPAGTYRYGYATAYDCNEAGCGSVGLFSVATVTSALAVDCAPTNGGTPTATSLTPPWGPGTGDPKMTGLKSCPDGGCSTAPGDDPVVLFDLLVVALGLAIVGWRTWRSRRATPRSTT